MAIKLKEAYLGDAPYIFVSYAHKNRSDHPEATPPFIDPFLAALQEQYNVWYDEGLSYDKPGYKEEIFSKIRGCSVFLNFVTKEYLASPFCNLELGFWEACRDDKKSQIVVMPEEIPHDSAMGFDKQQYLPLWEFASPEDAVADLKRKSNALKAAEKSHVSKNLLFRSNGDGTCSIAGLGDCGDVDLSPPSVSPAGDRVTEIEKEAFLNCRNLTSVVVPEGVTKIGDSAFCGCYALRSVTLPESLTEIGKKAFAECYNLSAISIPDGVTKIGNEAFSHCKSIPSVTIPNGVTSIGTQTFYECSSLTNVTIPNGVTSIGWGAFDGCSALTSIIIPDSVTSIGKDAFDNCPNLKYTVYDNANYLGNAENPYFALIGAANDSITSCNICPNTKIIAGSSFARCTSLTSIAIPDSVAGIGEFAFESCSSLTSVTIPGSVKSIGDFVFWFCSSLTSITILGRVKSIGNSAFWGCSSLTSVTIGNSVTSIGNWAFKDCSSLTSITIPDSVTSIGHKAFEGCSSLTSITIPDSVTSIGHKAFEGCSNLQYIVYDNAEYLGNTSNPYVVLMHAIGTSITSCTIHPNTKIICVGAFDGCASLTSIIIPDSVTSIGPAALSSCTSLENIAVTAGNSVYHSAGNCIIKTATKILIAGCKNSIIPGDGSVTSIGSWAFENCSSLTSITIPDSVTSIRKYSFNNCSALTSITYQGTIAQWNAIKKEDHWDLDTGAYTIHCSDGDIEKK